ncbi:MAG: hypothetical protein WBC18_13970 [Ottowia sp.]|uniref:hypothetical protein n=1 Tax=unclassified Ottowia TaxID=2645081 RepID=UPI003C2D94AA
MSDALDPITLDNQFALRLRSGALAGMWSFSIHHMLVAQPYFAPFSWPSAAFFSEIFSNQEVRSMKLLMVDNYD